ncbi:MAG: DUF2326 domain-containing protein [archaeon]
MFIKDLIITNGEEVIRDIHFHKGINLIIDETVSTDKKESGNNVGKTTILRLIDYCLGGSGTDIYKDPEFKDKNKTLIENFLMNNNIIITLTLVDDLSDDSSRKIIIKRNFLQRKEKIASINSKNYSDIKFEFTPKLKELIFNSESKKPTFRQIISKNIRDDKFRLLNTVKTLHSTSKQEEYEALFLFWLGIEFDSIDEKQELEQKKSITKKFLDKLKKDTTLSEIEQSLIILEKDISFFENKKKELNLNENYDADLKSLNNIKLNITQLSTELSQLELRKELIIESKNNLESEKTSINAQEIRKFYDEAKRLLPNIQKTFEQTIDFHNKMIYEKISYITKELPEIVKRETILTENIRKLLLEEKKFTEIIRKSDLLLEVEKIATELNKLYEQKGKFTEQKNQWNRTIKDLNDYETKLDTINKYIESKDKLIEERITKFNDFFSAISNRLCGERFVLSSDKNEKGYELNIGSIGGNLGTGKKKGQIVAFDFAYILFAESLNINCIHFILHDQIENIHNNQIENILTEIVNEVNCQYIIPVLKDKLPKNIDITKLKVITLSQSDKLFKI